MYFKSEDMPFLLGRYVDKSIFPKIFQYFLDKYCIWEKDLYYTSCLSDIPNAIHVVTNHEGETYFLIKNYNESNTTLLNIGLTAKDAVERVLLEYNSIFEIIYSEYLFENYKTEQYFRNKELIYAKYTATLKKYIEKEMKLYLE